eukprot:GFYU01001528.1.p1 GENE.GFYU01001528.1~~GFYU01001528.1.p1  ORF type:complete len:600 (-),score=112.14 GFYU01001528.1:30-1829(-)
MSRSLLVPDDDEICVIPATPPAPQRRHSGSGSVGLSQSNDIEYMGDYDTVLNESMNSSLDAEEFEKLYAQIDRAAAAVSSDAEEDGVNSAVVESIRNLGARASRVKPVRACIKNKGMVIAACSVAGLLTILFVAVMMPRAAHSSRVPTSTVLHADKKIVSVDNAEYKVVEDDLFDANVDVLSETQSHVDLLVNPTQLQLLDSKDVKYTVRVHNVQSKIDEERQELVAAMKNADKKINELRLLAGQTRGVQRLSHHHNHHNKNDNDLGTAHSEAESRRLWFDTYQSYDSVVEFLDGLATRDVPSGLTVTKFSAGASVHGRDQVGLFISGASSGTEHDHTGASDNNNRARPAVLFNGGQHAREWITVSTVCYLAYQMIKQFKEDRAVRALLREVDIYVIPVMNPDGYVYTWTDDRLWRKNRRLNYDGSHGVDLNRNWDQGWNQLSWRTPMPDSQVYHGEAPLSEPETRNVADFIADRPDMKGHVDFHSYGQYIFRPWSYTHEPIPDEDRLRELGLDISTAILDTHHSFYDSMRAIDFTNAPGTMHDYTFSRGLTSYAIELRDTGTDGFLLKPRYIRPTCEEIYKGMLVFAQSFVHDTQHDA